MPDTHVWEEEEVVLRVAGLGAKYDSTRKVQFVFETDDANEVDVGSADVDIQKDTAAARRGHLNPFEGTGKLLKTKKPVDVKGSTFGELWYRAKYKLKVNSEVKKNFTDKVYVYAKKITVTAIDETDPSKKIAGAKCVLTQMPAPDSKFGGQAYYSVEKETGVDGKIEFTLKYPSSIVSLEWKRPHVGTWTPGKDKGVDREAKLKYAPKLKLDFPKPDPEFPADVPHRQYVNMPADALDAVVKHPENGNTIKIKIVPVTPAECLPGRKVFLKAKFDAENNDRPGAVKKKGQTLELEGALADDKSVTFELDLGHAGGDKCVVSIGSVKGTTDDQVIIQTWRKLHYELMAPDFMVATLPVAKLPDGTNGFDLAAKLNDFKKKAFDKCFIEYTVLRSHSHGEGTCFTVVPSEYIGREAGGRKCYIASKRELVKANDPVAFGAAQNNCIHIRLCDRAFQTKVLSYNLKLNLTAASTREKLSAVVGASVFPTQPNTGTKTLSFGGATWKAVTTGCDPAHPAFDGTTPRGGALDEAWITHVDEDFVQITLPSGGPTDPGTLAGAKSADKCPIEIKFAISVPDGEVNGSSATGRQILVVKPKAPESNGATLCHELGHNMGMTILPGKNRKPPGTPDAKNVDGGGNYYRQPGPGDKVGKKGVRTTGHNGGHCSEGAPDKSKTKTFGGAVGTCLLWGEGGDDDTTNKRKSFCAQCELYLKARKLADIQTSYVVGSTRVDDDC